VIDAFEPEEFNALFDEDKVFNPVFKGEHQVVRSFTSSLFERLRTLSTTYSHKKTKMKMIQLMVLIEMRLNNNNLSLDQIFGHSVDYIYDIEQMTKLNDLLTYIGTMLIDVAVYIDRGNANIPTSIRQAIDYIETHFNEDISMQDVAEIVYLNPWYFSELFREKTGITFTDYITNTRIDNAKRLLRQSRLKNFEIAGRVGFDNASYFNYIFKKKVGITPRTYRQMI
jgi:two-component system response regulator YesN